MRPDKSAASIVPGSIFVGRSCSGIKIKIKGYIFLILSQSSACCCDFVFAVDGKAKKRAFSISDCATSRNWRKPSPARCDWGSIRATKAP